MVSKTVCLLLAQRRRRRFSKYYHYFFYMPTCCVPNCRSGYDAHDTEETEGQSTLSFHRFPLKEPLKSIWLRSIHRNDFTPTSYTRVCSVHFCNDDYKQDSTDSNQRRRRKRRNEGDDSQGCQLSRFRCDSHACAINLTPSRLRSQFSRLKLNKYLNEYVIWKKLYTVLVKSRAGFWLPVISTNSEIRSY